MYFQEFQQIEGVTSPIPTVVGDGPLEVYTHAKPALVVTPEHVRSIQLTYYDELSRIRIRFTKEATEKMVASLKEPEGKRLMTGIVDGKPNGNQAFSVKDFTMEFFFHSLDDAVKIVKAYEKTSEDIRINRSRRDRVKEEDRYADDSLQTNADEDLNIQNDVATSLPDGTPFRNIKSGIPPSHRSWAEPGDEVVLRSPQTEEGKLATMLPDGTPFRSTASGIPQETRSWVEPGDKVVLRRPVPKAKQQK